jgi:hypothetical protein
VFPVLFPVCSQIPANAFKVFPMFFVPGVRAISPVSVFPFSQPRNTGNNGNPIEIQGVARRATVEQPWNDWERTEARWMNGGGAGTTADSWLRPFEGE